MSVRTPGAGERVDASPRRLGLANPNSGSGVAADSGRDGQRVSGQAVAQGAAVTEPVLSRELVAEGLPRSAAARVRRRSAPTADRCSVFTAHTTSSGPEPCEVGTLASAERPAVLAGFHLDVVKRINQPIVLNKRFVMFKQKIYVG